MSIASREPPWERVDHRTGTARRGRDIGRDGASEFCKARSTPCPAQYMSTAGTDFGRSEIRASSPGSNVHVALALFFNISHCVVDVEGNAQGNSLVAASTFLPPSCSSKGRGQGAESAQNTLGSTSVIIAPHLTPPYKRRVNSLDAVGSVAAWSTDRPTGSFKILR